MESRATQSVQADGLPTSDFTMVFYFKVWPDAGDYTVFMGLDKFKNEDLNKYNFPEDIWMSSAYVYLILNKGQAMDDISEGVLEDSAQLVKANSIQGNKSNNIDVVYTPWHNLKKTSSMDVGQVGFHNSKGLFGSPESQSISSRWAGILGSQTSPKLVKSQYFSLCPCSLY
ncbi:hypothetical protein GUJ93_ZPchr0016g2603 [Zizania palustris]|uniref:NFACT RNA-binding domain-containing protein n=1 Tax=Zizania palustris TaxID=103762 RepID=A0A8J5SZ27_ZIZPA|nr:hypothetical protein GUJ93_ZPchr0016g2603 [Zizania palustris]